MLEDLLSESDWLVGNRLTLADIAVAAQFHEILATSVLKPKIVEYKNIMGWYE